MKKSGPFAVCVHTAKDFWSLCRVHTHGKGATWRSPVRLGAPGGSAGKAFAVRASRWAHGKASFTAYPGRTATTTRTAKRSPHGNAESHGKVQYARHSGVARQRVWRTADQRVHGKGLCRVNLRCARQRILCRRYLCRSVVTVRLRTVKALPCK